jgi:tight adherence protein C
MEMLVTMIAVLIFADILLFATALIAYEGPTRAARRRKDLRPEQPRSSVARLLHIPFVDRLLKPAMRRMISSIGRRAPGNMLSDTERQLERAGRPFGMSPEGYVTFRAFMLVAGVAGGYWLLTGPMANSAYGVLSAGTLFIVAALTPTYILQKSTERRHAEIRKTLPDIIDLLVVSVEAGSGLDGALSEVIARKQGILVDEFDRLLGEMRVGKSRRQAWESMAERVNEDNLSALVASLVQAEEVGVSIARALRAQAETVRVQRSLQIREMAATLPLKMLFPLIFFIFPTLFVVILGPGLLGLTGMLDILSGK